MFRKIYKTFFSPKEKPVMIWDGQCGFCRYWITVLEGKTGGKIDYEAFQDVSSRFSDIPEAYFVDAVRLIETDGTVYNGPDAAYRSMLYWKKRPVTIWHKWYGRYSFFRKLSDYIYQFVSSHRPFMLFLTKWAFGNNPKSLKPYWLIYISIVLLIIFNVL